MNKIMQTKENGEVILVGVDIYEFVKGLCEQFLGESPTMTDGEKKAYKLGINNTLSLLNQTLNEVMVESEYDNDINKYIAVHIPELKIMEEFDSVDEILDKMMEN